MRIDCTPSGKKKYQSQHPYTHMKYKINQFANSTEKKKKKEADPSN